MSKVCRCQRRTKSSFEYTDNAKHRHIHHSRLAAYELLLPSTQANFFDGLCMALLHLSLPAYSSHCHRLGRESISSLAVVAVMEFLLSSASATRSGVAFAFFTASPFPSDSFVLHAFIHLSDHALPHTTITATRARLRPCRTHKMP